MIVFSRSLFSSVALVKIKNDQRDVKSAHIYIYAHSHIHSFTSLYVSRLDGGQQEEEGRICPALFFLSLLYR